MNDGAVGSRLYIFDDIFPQMLSAFRVAEYNACLERFAGARVYSTATAFPAVGETRSFREVLDEYESRYPAYRGRVREYVQTQDMRSELVYTVFINNAVLAIHIAERDGAPFAFTLYPGGGFRLRDAASDRKLRRVFSSPNFRKVIVTQTVSLYYLVDQGLCSPDQIEFIYGGVLPLVRPDGDARRGPAFGHGKNTFDICFVANKHTPGGIDKGYDIFVAVARLLCAACGDVVFHVVGPFDASDADVTGIEDRVHFHGWKYTDSFADFYSGMDAILSPNRPNVLGPGSFDGFPTGACVEAALCGVAVFCTDPLHQNVKFKNGSEIVIVGTDVREICARLLYFYQRPERLHALSSQGQRAFEAAFSFGAQVRPRLDLLASLMAGN